MCTAHAWFCKNASLEQAQREEGNFCNLVTCPTKCFSPQPQEPFHGEDGTKGWRLNMWFALLHILQLKLPWACMYRWESCSECPPLPFLLGAEAFCPMHLTCESTCNVFSTRFQETPKSIFFSVSANVFLFTGYKPHLTPGICQLPVTTAPAKSADAWSLWGAKALHCSAYVWCCSFFSPYLPPPPACPIEVQ